MRRYTKALNDFRLANFAGHDVSDVKCNRDWKTRDWNAQAWAGVKGGVYTTDESQVNDWEPYIIHGKAGDALLSMDDVHGDDGELFGMSCGVKFPARIREFQDRKWHKPGGVSMGTACVASSGFKGHGDAENAPSKKVDCVMELNIEVHNCNDFTLWMLPKVTTQMMRRAVGPLFVKVAYINLQAMDSDNSIPLCVTADNQDRGQEDSADDDEEAAPFAPPPAPRPGPAFAFIPDVAYCLVATSTYQVG